MKREIDALKLITPEFHNSFDVFMSSDYLEMAEFGGRGSGKSTNILFMAIIRVIQDKVDCLIMRKVANTLRTSVFAQVIWNLLEMDILKYFKVNKSTMEIIYKKTGAGFYFRGADDPGAMKSLKTKYPIGITIFEEADQFKSYDEIEVIKLSTLRGNASYFKYVYMFNPPRNKYHWANLKWIFGNNKGVFIHQSNYTGNPKLPRQFYEEAERMKEENPQRYKWVYLGEPIGSDVVPFPNLIIEKELDEELINSFDKIKQGLDWGYGGDAFAFARCHYDKRNKTIYVFGEIYGHGLSNYTTATRIKEKGWNDFTITADSAEKKSIAEYLEYGINTTGTKKGPGSVETGFRWLGDHTIIVCQKRCPNIAREFQMADFKIDKDGNLTSQLVGSDHGLDAVRYAFESEYSYGGLKVLK